MNCWQQTSQNARTQPNYLFSCRLIMFKVLSTSKLLLNHHSIDDSFWESLSGLVIVSKTKAYILGYDVSLALIVITLWMIVYGKYWVV